MADDGDWRIVQDPYTLLVWRMRAFVLEFTCGCAACRKHPDFYTRTWARYDVNGLLSATPERKAIWAQLFLEP